MVAAHKRLVCKVCMDSGCEHCIQEPTRVQCHHNKCREVFLTYVGPRKRDVLCAKGHWSIVQNAIERAAREDKERNPPTQEANMDTTHEPTPVGQKFDGGKDEPGLLLTGCSLAVAGVIRVLSFGFKKYKKRNGWKEVPEAKRRYKDAMHRHLMAIERGELVDPESGLPHIDHVACNAMFLSQMHHEGFGD